MRLNHTELMKELQTLQQEIISKAAEYSALKYANNRIKPGVIPPSAGNSGITEYEAFRWMPYHRRLKQFEAKLADYLGGSMYLVSTPLSNLVAFSALHLHVSGRAIKKVMR